MSDVFNSIGEGVANLFGAGPQGGPLGGFKPFAQGVDDLAAGALAPETGGLSLAVPGAFAAEDAAKGNVLGAVGNLAAVGGGAYNAGLIGGGGAGAGGAAGAAAPAAAAGGAATAPGDFSAAFQPADVSVPEGALPGSFVAATSETIPGVTNPSNLLQTVGLEAPTQGFSPLGSGGLGALAEATATPTAGIGSQVSNWWGGSNLNPSNWGGPTVTPNSVGSALPGASTVQQLPPPSTFGTPNPDTGLADFSTGAGGGSGGQGFIQSIKNFNPSAPLSSLGNVASSIPAGAYIGAAGLGYEALKGNPPIPNLSTLNSIAGQAESNSQSLINAELSGKLPPGAAAGVQQGLEAAQANIRSQFAEMGLTGSSAETDALANASQQASAQSFQIASQMAQQGISLAGLPANIYEAITQQVLGEDTQFQNAIVNFATAAGGSGGVRLQVGGTQA